jgi:hypothetical protein
MDAKDSAARTKLSAVCGAVLWLVLTGMYVTAAGLFAFLGLIPVAALLVRGENRRVLQGSVVLGVVAAVLGVVFYQTTTAAWRFEVVGVIVLPMAITLYSGVALWRLPAHRPAS